MIAPVVREVPVGPLVAALFFPPLSVYLVRGMDRRFGIALALTAAFFIPGVLYALVSIFRPNHGWQAARAELSPRMA